MIEEADRDGDGEIAEEEFMRIMRKTNLFWARPAQSTLPRWLTSLSSEQGSLREESALWPDQSSLSDLYNLN